MRHAIKFLSEKNINNIVSKINRSICKNRYLLIIRIDFIFHFFENLFILIRYYIILDKNQTC